MEDTKETSDELDDSSQSEYSPRRRRKSTREFIDEWIWMLNNIRQILKGYRAEIKELKRAGRLVDCIEVLSDSLATLQGIKNEMTQWNKDIYVDYWILEEILHLLRIFRHEILNYWNEISHEDCLGILNDIRDLLRDYATEKERKCYIVNQSMPRGQFKKTSKMMRKISKDERRAIEELRIKIRYLTEQLNFKKRKTEKEEEFNASKVAEEWEGKRSQVLRRIAEIEDTITSISKWMSIFKMTIYSTGVLCTATKYFCFTDSKNRTLMPVILIGSIGLSVMLAKKFTNDRLKGLFEILAEDQVLLASILQQYDNTNELESGIENMFPFDITKNIVEEFSGNTKSYSMSCLLDILLEKRKHSEPDSTNTKIHNTFQKLAMQPSFLWNWLLSEKSKEVFIIIAKVKLLYHENVILQTENTASENLQAICFWGSLFLDGLSVIKEFDRLRSFECRQACIMGVLKSHLMCEMEALKEIVKKS